MAIKPYNYTNPEKVSPEINTTQATQGMVRIKPYSYFNSKTSDILKQSNSPFKLSGQTILSQGAEKNPPLGFIGKAVKAAYNTTKDTIEGAATKIQEFIGTLDKNAKSPYGTDYTKVTGETIGMTLEQRKAFYCSLCCGSKS